MKGRRELMDKKPFLLAGLALILSACTSPDDEYDYIESTPVTITASPLNARVGEEVEVNLLGRLKLDERSRVPERPISDTTLGVCFGYGLTANGEGIADPHGFCLREVEVLPGSYQMLNGTGYTKEFDDVVIRRGESQEFKHTFTFTLTEVNKLVLAPVLDYKSDYEGNTTSGNITQNYPIVTFE